MRVAPYAMTVLTAILFSGVAYAAQPLYSDESVADSNDTVPQRVEPMKHAHYGNRPITYSDESIADSNDTVPVQVERPKVDRMSTASTRPLPDCHSMLYGKGSVHTAGGDSGTADSDACRATH